MNIAFVGDELSCSILSLELMSRGPVWSKRCLMNCYLNQ